MNTIFASVNAASAVLNYYGGHQYWAALAAGLAVWFVIHAIRVRA